MFIFIIFGLIRSSDKLIRDNYTSFFSNVQYYTVALFEKIKNPGDEEFKKKNKHRIHTRCYTCVFPKPGLGTENPGFWDAESKSYEKFTFTAIESWKSNKIFGDGIK